MKILVSLVGEQPMPNVLAIRQLKPDKNVFFYSQTTYKVSEKLKKMFEGTESYSIEPYEFNVAREGIIKHLNKYADEKNVLIFNITGGTKIMSLALFQVALENKSNIIYIRSENKESLMDYYTVKDNYVINRETIKLPELINVKDYLTAHIPYYDLDTNKNSSDRGRKYEESIKKALENDFEIISGIRPKPEGNKLEIDLLLRLKGTNNVAIAEVKIGGGDGPKKGIDQLALASQREYLGIYTTRFLITSSSLKRDIKELALAHRINVVDEIFESNKDMLNKEVKEKLLSKIKEKMS